MPYNPYPYNPYPQSYYPPQQPQANVYAFVNGVEGAKAYAIQPNQQVMLMDSDQPLVYLKSSNAMGQASLKYYRLTEIDEVTARGKAPTADYATKADLEALAKRIDELTAPKEAK